MSKSIDFIIHNFLHILLSIPKTVVFNFKVLPILCAVKFPFVVSYRVKCKGINKKSFLVADPKKLRTASCRIGFGNTVGNCRESKKCEIICLGSGKIVLNGTVGLSEGCILIASNAVLTFGKNFRCNYSTTIDCAESNITFGNDVVCGWNVTFKNSDGHYIVDRGGVHSLSGEITIGNHVWICSHATVLKNCCVGDDSVVAYGSLLTKAHGEQNVIFGGCPAKIIRTDINWKE